MTLLPETTKLPPPMYVNRSHYNKSGRRASVKVPNGRTVRARYVARNTCPCDECRKVKSEDRAALIAKVAAEMGVEVATAPAKKQPITPAWFEKRAEARRRALISGAVPLGHEEKPW